MFNVYNFVIYQLAWFAVVLGAARGFAWLGAAMALLVNASTFLTYRNRPPAEPPSASGDFAPISGTSSPSITRESPIWISACATFPSGPGMRIFSFAPNARL